jgi:hypothetical protein
MKPFLVIAAYVMFCGSLCAKEATLIGSKTMPKGYVLTEDSTSPDGNLGFIHRELAEVPDEGVDFAKFRNYLVRVAPFEILAENLGESYFHPGNHRNVAFEWSASGDVGILFVGGKWGTIGATMFEMEEWNVKRKTDLLKLVNRELSGPFAAAKVKPYNDFFPFIISDEDEWKLDRDGRKLRIEVGVMTRPNLAPGRAWEGTFKGIWDVRAAKWSERKAAGEVVIHPE